MRRMLAVAVLVAMAGLMPAAVNGQGRGRGAGAQGGPAQPAPTPRAAAPIDLTGYWVSIVSEDWRWRMGVGQKGDFGYLPLNAEGRRVGNEWDPAADAAAGNQCKAFGAIGIMRQPTRLNITWENDTTLKIEADHGMQTRRLNFGNAAGAAAAEPSSQGYSVANWEVRGRGRNAPPPRTGELKVVTTKLRPGYYYKHGVPYSENAVLTEYYARLSDEGAEYLAVTTIVDDPRYLAGQFVRTVQFRREPNGAKWNPRPCA